MTTYNDKPILSHVGFYNSVNTTPKTQILETVNVKDLENMYLYFTLTGLEHQPPGPELITFPKFYINIALFNHRGGRDTIKYNNYSHLVDTYNEATGSKTFSLLINLIDDEMKHSKDFYFDLSYTFLSCTIFYSHEEIKDDETFLRYYNTPFYTLYNSKLPLIGGERNG